MKISTRGRYGLRALIDLAAYADKKCISIKSIAERQGLSENYLEQLIAPLKKAGYVESVRGSQGGYQLKISADKMSVGNILRVLEGPLYPVDCLADGEGSSCGTGSCESCVTKDIWAKMYDSINEVLESVTLNDLVNDYKQKQAENGKIGLEVY